MADDLLAFNDRMIGEIGDRQPIYSEAVAAVRPMLADIDSLLILNKTLAVRVAELTRVRDSALMELTSARPDARRKAYEVLSRSQQADQFAELMEATTDAT